MLRKVMNFNSDETAARFKSKSFHEVREDAVERHVA
jgi:hypothetical protein